MIKWEILGDSEGQTVYKRIDQDGLVRVTAIVGYPELDEYLASKKTSKAKVPVEPEVVEPEAPEAE
jgi:hypothetical protein